MSELEKRIEELNSEFNEDIITHDNFRQKFDNFLLSKIAELQLKIEALEATKISGDTRIGGQPKPEQNGF